MFPWPSKWSKRVAQSCCPAGRRKRIDAGGNRTPSRRWGIHVRQNSFCLDKDFLVAEMSHFWPFSAIICNLSNHGNVAIIYCLDNDVLHGKCISSGSKTVGLRGSFPFCSGPLAGHKLFCSAQFATKFCMHPGGRGRRFRLWFRVATFCEIASPSNAFIPNRE